MREIIARRFPSIQLFSVDVCCEVVAVYKYFSFSSEPKEKKSVEWHVEFRFDGIHRAPYENARYPISPATLAFSLSRSPALLCDIVSTLKCVSAIYCGIEV